jgi:hypothetical protein
MASKQNYRIFFWVKNDFGPWLRDKTVVILSGQKFISGDLETKQSQFYLGIKMIAPWLRNKTVTIFFLGKKWFALVFETKTVNFLSG